MTVVHTYFYIVLYREIGRKWSL